MYAVAFLVCALASQTFATFVVSPLLSTPAVVSSRSSQFISQNFNNLAVPAVPSAPSQFVLYPASPPVAPAVGPQPEQPGQVEDFSARLRSGDKVEVEAAKVRRIDEVNVAPLLAAHLAAAGLRNAERAQVAANLRSAERAQEVPAARAERAQQVSAARVATVSARLAAVPVAPAARLAAVPAVASPYLASSAFSTSNFYRNVVVV